MIKRNETVGKNKDVIIAEFGKGDILVTGVKQEDGLYAGIELKNIPPCEVGDFKTEYKEIPSDILITFTNRRSIKVVMNALLIVEGELRLRDEKYGLKRLTDIAKSIECEFTNNNDVFEELKEPYASWCKEIYSITNKIEGDSEKNNLQVDDILGKFMIENGIKLSTKAVNQLKDIVSHYDYKPSKYGYRNERPKIKK